MKFPGILRGLLVMAGAAVLILDGKCAMEAGAEGVSLCLKTVIPSLFPFLFLSSVLKEVLWGWECKVLTPLCRRLGIPEGGQSLLLAAFLGGYPAGAQAVAETWRAGKITRKEAENLLSFCSNAGPAFLFGMTAVQFSDLGTVWLLWGIQILSAVAAGLVMSAPTDRKIQLTGDRQSLSACLNGAVTAMGAICGWILLFRILLAFLERWALWLLPRTAQVLLSGLLELSIGCVRLGEIAGSGMRFVVCSAMLSFGGVCVAMQTVSVTQGLSLMPYLRGKLLQTGLSILLALALCFPKAGIPAVAMALLFIFPRMAKKRGGNRQLSVV